MRLAIVAGLAALGSLAPPAAAQGEYEVKAAIVYNIARFVEWPKSPQATVTVCILGSDPFGGGMEALSGRPVGTDTLVVRRIAGPHDAGGCQLVFISSSEAGRLPIVLAALPSREVLTVGDTPGYAQAGVAINLYLEANRVRFEVNLQAAQRTGLVISSQLLKLARITHDRSGTDG